MSMSRGGVVVLDDDPTGTQSAAEVPVLLDVDRDWLRSWFAAHEPSPVYVLTNTRAMPANAAREVVSHVTAAARACWPDAQIVLRGDSTLRGHVLPEYLGAVGSARPPLLLVPAMPHAGRVTLDGTHFLRRGTTLVRLDQTEFARDGDFGYSTSDLLGWADERSDGFFAAERGICVTLATLRKEGPAAVEGALRKTHLGDGAVVCVPDAESLEDLVTIRDGLGAARNDGIDVVVRCAPPFAALVADRLAPGLVDLPRAADRILVVVGSYVATTTAQLAELRRRRPDTVIDVNLERLLDEPKAYQKLLAYEVTARWEAGGPAVLSTPRRGPRSGVVSDALGMRVAMAMAHVLDFLGEPPGFLIGKGGITSALLVRNGLGASEAWVQGSPRAGLSLWDVPARDGRDAPATPFVVFAGNVGEESGLADLLDEVVNE